ncbi:tyrosine-type recombinase/integrase [Marivivens niveibacter]|nr:site-specific integrase [Marivivens niveibacter]
MNIDTSQPQAGSSTNQARVKRRGPKLGVRLRDPNCDDTVLHSLMLALKSRLAECPFATPNDIRSLKYRENPYFFGIMQGFHIGIYRPDAVTCTWIARYLNPEKKYRQHALGPALSFNAPALSLDEAVRRALKWFSDPQVNIQASKARVRGKTTEVAYCPIDHSEPTIGSILRTYMEWRKISATPKGFYNALVSINYFIIPVMGNVTVSEFSNENMRTLANLVLSTKPRSGFEAHKAPQDMSDLTPDDLRKRKRTYNVLVGYIKQALQYAYDDGVLENDRKVRLARRLSLSQPKIPKFISVDQCAALISQCEGCLRNLVKAALYTGCRVGELAKITAADVGAGGHGVQIGPFKYGKGRFVFLSDEGMRFFETLSENRNSDDLLFMSPLGKPWRRQHNRPFNIACANVGIPPEFTFHGLRHTYASHMIMQRVPLEVISQQLGHRSILTTFQYYGHLADKFREDEIRSKSINFGLCREH